MPVMAEDLAEFEQITLAKALKTQCGVCTRLSIDEMNLEEHKLVCTAELM